MNIFQNVFGSKIQGTFADDSVQMFKQRDAIYMGMALE